MRRRPTLTVRETASNPSNPAQTKNTGIQRSPLALPALYGHIAIRRKQSSAGSGHGAPYCPPVLLDYGAVGVELLLDEQDQFGELVIAEIVEDRAAGAVGQVVRQPFAVVMGLA